MENKQKIYHPFYSRGFTVPLTQEELDAYRTLKNGYYQNAPEEFEWLQKLSDTDGTTLFRIKYFGEIFSRRRPYLIIGKKKGLIFKTYIPPKIIAENPITGNQILIFDSFLHGYEAIFCGAYENLRKIEREPMKVLANPDGNDLFELFISVYYQIDFDQELSDLVDKNGKLTIGKDRISFEEAKSNGFDSINIHIKNIHNQWFEIADYELA